MATYEERWEIESLIGEGGQGTVHKVFDKSKVQSVDAILKEFVSAINGLTAGVQVPENRTKNRATLYKTMREIVKRDESADFSALKVLHGDDKARDASTADQRLDREIRAMQEVKHPNLVEILDADTTDRWYVSRFYPNGTLDKKLRDFAGDFPKSLRAFRDLVAGVAELHKAGFVHRDIKPENIFVASDDSLVLGDFGLVYFQGDHEPRISATNSNVGTRAWMPPWAMEYRLEEVEQTFDVFSLGKVLWSMVSGLPKLPHPHFNDPDYPKFNVEKLWANKPFIERANELFGKCIVDRKSRCLGSAGVLLEEVNRLIDEIDNRGTRLGKNFNLRCSICGKGKYSSEQDRASIGFTSTENGFTTSDFLRFRVLLCDHCGHVQLFSRDSNGEFPGWRD